LARHSTEFQRSFDNVETYALVRRTWRWMASGNGRPAVITAGGPPHPFSRLRSFPLTTLPGVAQFDVQEFMVVCCCLVGRSVARRAGFSLSAAPMGAGVRQPVLALEFGVQGGEVALMRFTVTSPITFSADLAHRSDTRRTCSRPSPSCPSRAGPPGREGAGGCTHCRPSYVRRAAPQRAFTLKQDASRLYRASPSKCVQPVEMNRH